MAAKGKDIRIVSSDEEMRENDVDPEENGARLYGSDYFQLEEESPRPLRTGTGCKGET